MLVHFNFCHKLNMHFSILTDVNFCTKLNMHISSCQCVFLLNMHFSRSSIWLFC